jgi:hypothetical protein
MTQFQDSASLRKLDSPARALAAPLLAMAGIIVVLMAAAVMSYALAGRPSDATITAEAATIDGHTEAQIAANLQRLAAQGTEAIDAATKPFVAEYLQRVAAQGTEAIDAATKPFVAEYLQRVGAQSTANGSTIAGHTEALKAANLWRAQQQLNDGSDAARVLPRTNPAVHGWVPAEEAGVDASIYRFLLPADQATVSGSGLRFAPQPAETTGDGGNQRFVNVD